MTTITDQKKMELIKVARRQLAEEYNLQRNDDYKSWMGNCETVWRTSGNRLPLTPPPPMPSESEIVARALRLYNEMIAPATSTTQVKSSNLAAVISMPESFIVPAVVAPATTVIEPVIEPVIEIKPVPTITKTEFFADSVYDAPLSVAPAMIEKIVPDIVSAKSASLYPSGIYKIYQASTVPDTTQDIGVANTITDKPAVVDTQKTAKSDSLKNRLIGIFPQWINQ